MTTLTLYQTEITLDRNARVENIEKYLESLPRVYHSDKMQYLRIGANIVVKLPRNQELSYLSDCNYARIEQDGRVFYFFVMGADWRARKTVAFTLSMDTVNTWWDELSWNPKTTIQRQHGDRFYPTTNKLKLFRKIDFYNEGLNPALSYGTDEYPIEGGTYSHIDTNWYLIYKSRPDINPEETANPISVLLVADEPLLINKGTDETNSYTATIGEFCSDGIAWFAQDMAIPGLEGALIGSGTTEEDWLVFGKEHPDRPGSYLRVVRFIPTGFLGLIDIEALYYTGSTATNYAFDVLEHISTSTPWPAYNLKNFDYYRRSDNTDFYKNIREYEAIANAGEIIDIDGSITRKTIGFDEVDRSDSRISKIIKLPYAPTYVRKRPDGVVEFGGNWYYNTISKCMETILRDQIFSSNLDTVFLESQFIFELGSAPAG